LRRAPTTVPAIWTANVERGGSLVYWPSLRSASMDEAWMRAWLEYSSKYMFACEEPGTSPAPIIWKRFVM